jgi:hypothetical protein
MAKIKFNGLVDDFRGGVGGLVVRKSRGKYTVSNKPDLSTAEASQAQILQRRAFARAVAYGKSVMGDPEKLAFYEGLAAQKNMPAFSVCMGDYLNAPSMDEPDLSGYKGQVGDQILIITHDDTGVVDVNVELTRTDGTNIERGKAVELGMDSGHWVYTATAPVASGTDIFIEVEAFDRPGSRTVCSANPTVGLN